MTRITQEPTRRLEFDVAPERAWRALTDLTEISSWFGDIAELDLRSVGAGSYGWENHGNC